MSPLPVTAAVFVPPAVPVIVTSVPAKPVTGALKTAVKWIGDVFAGSACPAACSIVTVVGFFTVSVKFCVSLPWLLVTVNEIG